MPREKRYGDPRATRFKIFVDKRLKKFCKESEGRVRPSDVIQEAVECYLFHPKCQARKRRLY